MPAYRGHLSFFVALCALHYTSRTKNLLNNLSKTTMGALLLRRTFVISISAENATISLFWVHGSFTFFTRIRDLTNFRWHFFFCCKTALRASDIRG